MEDGAIRVRLERDAEPVEITLAWVHGTLGEILPRALPLLSAGESARFAGLEFPRRRESYLLGRYAAKRALQLLLHEPDASLISTASGVFDQPLVEYPSRRGTGITLTHTEGLALAVAFPAGHPLGIDVERKEPRRLAVLASQMTPAERSWAGTSGLDPLTSATLLWTMKEALAKALTTGMMSPWEIYETGEWHLVGEGILEARFRNFAQYRATTWQAGETIFSLALPRGSRLPAEAVDAIDRALRGQRPVARGHKAG